MEVHGAIGKGLSIIIKKLAQIFESKHCQLPSTNTWATPNFSAYWRQRFSVTLLKSRAQMATRILTNQVITAHFHPAASDQHQQQAHPATTGDPIPQHASPTSALHLTLSTSARTHNITLPTGTTGHTQSAVDLK